MPIFVDQNCTFSVPMFIYVCMHMAKFIWGMTTLLTSQGGTQQPREGSGSPEVQLGTKGTTQIEFLLLTRTLLH